MAQAASTTYNAAAIISCRVTRIWEYARKLNSKKVFKRNIFLIKTVLVCIGAKPVTIGIA